MRLAYLDTSYLLGILFGEAGARDLARQLSSFDLVFSSSMLEAEVASLFAREHIATDWTTALAHVTWIRPQRQLTEELRCVLRCGYVRGADCWHLACALHLGEPPADLVFLSLDHRQREVAAALGFRLE